jgi:hypothetical protein
VRSLHALLTVTKGAEHSLHLVHEEGGQTIVVSWYGAQECMRIEDLAKFPERRDIVNLL